MGRDEKAYDKKSVTPLRVTFVEATSGKGGSAGCLIRLLPNLMQKGIAPSVIAFKANDRINSLKHFGVPIVDLELHDVVPPEQVHSVFGIPIPTTAFFKLFFLSLRAIVASKARVVYLNSQLQNHLAVLIAAKLLHRKVICHIRENQTLLRSERLGYTLVDLSVVLSDRAKSFYADQGIDRSRLVRVYDALSFKPEYEEPAAEIDDKEFKLAIVGALIPRKGHRFLFEALHTLGSANVPSWRLLVIGDGPLKPELERVVRDMRLQDTVEFLGYRDDVAAILRGCDVLVIPSTQEGFPQVALEAMALGKPVVMSRLIGVDEFIHDGENGLIVAPQDSRALASAIERLMRSRAATRRLGETARRFVKSGRFTPEAEASAIIEAIRGVSSK